MQIIFVQGKQPFHTKIHIITNLTEKYEKESIQNFCRPEKNILLLYKEINNRSISSTPTPLRYTFRNNAYQLLNLFH